jgi:broad specificity phosphatase PhoE
LSVILTLICHAATAATRDAAFPLDEPLEPQGQAKAAALAATVRRLDAAWTSPARRAVETAAALQIEAAVDPALRDTDYGSWAGRRLDDVAAADPTGVAAWMSDTAAAPHGGDSVDDLFQRIAPWMESIGSQDGRIVAVTHASVMRATIILALGAPSLSFWRIDVGPLARVRLRGQSGRWTLLSLSAD